MYRPTDKNTAGLTWIEWRVAAAVPKLPPIKMLLAAIKAWESGKDPAEWRKENQDDE